MLDEPGSNQARLEPRSGGMRVLLVGVDGGEGGERALQAGGSLAQQLGLSVIVGHVQPLLSSGTGGEGVQQLRDDLEIEVVLQAAKALDPLQVPWRLALTDGEPAHGLRRLADCCDAALIIIGTRGCGPRPALRRLVRGSVSNYLVHHESRPVLVVPQSFVLPATQEARPSG
jgi:nucleotide-binding universal stress UspA family protein